MVLTKGNMCKIAVACIGMMLVFSSCAKKDSGETGYGSAYLENMGNGICQQHPEGLMWQFERSPNFSSWDDANQYVSSLDLGGYNDWRLPSQDECLKLSRLLMNKKGDCPMKTGGNHWVKKSEGAEPGQWESNVYCDGPEFRWTKDKKGTVKGVRP